jgi:hypothetical protein
MRRRSALVLVSVLLLTGLLSEASLAGTGTHSLVCVDVSATGDLLNTTAHDVCQVTVGFGPCASGTVTVSIAYNGVDQHVGVDATVRCA